MRIVQHTTGLQQRYLVPDLIKCTVEKLRSSAAPVYMPRPYSISRRHHVFPLPGKVYSSDGVRDSASEKKCRFEYFAAHIDCETAEVLLTTPPSPPDDVDGGLTSALLGSTPFIALPDFILAVFKSAFFAIIAVNSNCTTGEDWHLRGIMR